MPDESRLPRFTAIIRIGFGVAVRLGRDIGPDTAHQDGPVLERILLEQFASPVFKGADQR